MDLAVRRAAHNASWPRTGACALLLCGLHGTAPALGPRAPFTPPATAPAESSTALPGDAPSATGGAPAAADAAALAGVRVGRLSMALIDGQWWPLGSRPRGAVLVAVTSQGAWLRHADGRREWLALNPLGPLNALSPLAPLATAGPPTPSSGKAIRP
ncbi:MAG: hypothetical protein KIT17_01895 [Rubrivivax sp.]|nr:hypothetical protein [Rubrivivax sp.]